MKKFTDKGISVQRKDLYFIMNLSPSVPTFLIYKNLQEKYHDISNEYNEEYVEFTKEEEISYFEDLNMLYDIEQFSNMTTEEIISLINELIGDIDVLAKSFNELPELEKLKNQNQVINYKVLVFKFETLKKILKDKRMYNRKRV